MYHRERDYYWEKWLALCEEMPLVFHGSVFHIYNCPLKKRHIEGKNYADLVHDCWYCDYYIWNIWDERRNQTAILCSGGKKIKTLEDLKEYYGSE